jgi:DNA-directed RNA polymerase alpha subunit
MLINRIDYWINEGDFKLEEIAEKMSIDLQVILDWINNRSQPDLIQAAILSKIINIPIDFLVIDNKELKKDPLDEDIYSLDLSVRVHNLLKRKRINTIGELLDFDLTNIGGLGPKSIEEIRFKLDSFKRELGIGEGNNN